MAGNEKHLGKYVLKSQLGQGGMGVVYLATDERLKRDVALKILPRRMSSNPEAVGRFFREARVVARLNHPNVVVIHDVDQERGYCYLVMELLTGGTMQQLITHGPISWTDATAIIAQACRGLAAAQDAGLIHRDIKPSNIMRSADGSVKLTDFGLAKITDETTGTDPLTKTNTILGTPQYMSPEQCRGEPLDVRTDVYSLGATYYALLVGRPPFRDTQPLQVMYAHCNKPAPDPRAGRDDIPSGCADIVLRAMAKNRADRFASAREMLTALGQVLVALPSAAIQELPRPSDRRSRAEELPPTIALAPAPLSGEQAPAPPSRPMILTTLRDLALRHRRIVVSAAAGLLLLLIIGLAARRWFGDTNAANGTPKGQPITLEFAAELPGVDAAIRSVAFSSDSKSLFAGALDGSVRQWDVARKQIVRTFAGTQQGIMAVAVNQHWLAAGGRAKAVWLWKLDAHQPHSSLLDFGGEISALAISPDGKRLAVGTYAEVKLFELNPAGARLLKVLGTSTTEPINCYMVMCVAFSPDSRSLAATSWTDRKVFVWNAADGSLRAMQQRLADDPMAIAFVSGQDKAVCGLHHGGLVLWDIGANVVRPIPASADTLVRSLALTPDGQTVAVVGEWDGPIRLFDLQGSAPPRLFPKSTGTSAVSAAFSPDAKRLATGGGEDGQRRGYLHLWRVKSD